MVVAVLGSSQAVGAPGPLAFYADKAVYEAAVGQPTTEIDFEEIYPSSGSSCGDQALSIANPLTIDGVTFTDPVCLYESAMNLQIPQFGLDIREGGLRFRGPDLNVSTSPATIDLPPGTCGVGLNVFSNGVMFDSFILLEAIDATTTVSSGIHLLSGFPIFLNFVGFGSETAISQVRLLPDPQASLGFAPLILSVELAACAGGGDLNGDGISDSLQPVGTPAGSFVDGGTTAGAVGAVPAGYAVAVTDLPDPDGVHIVVSGTGTEKVTIVLSNPVTGVPCGTVKLLPGADIEFTCGSITTHALVGSAEIVLSSATSVFVDAPEKATVSIAADGSLVVLGPVVGGDGKLTLVTSGVSIAIDQSSPRFPPMITITSLCKLTTDYIKGSAKYAAATEKQRAAVDALTKAACNILTAITPKLNAKQKTALLSSYKTTVQALVPPGWLSQLQADTLKALANTL